VSNLLCVVCWYVRKRPRPALTVLNGYAVCDDHIDLLPHGDRWASVRAEALEAERHAEDTP
jgi:hypothetical protein